MMPRPLFRTCMTLLLGLAIHDEPKPASATARTLREIEVESDLALDKDATINARILIKASNITIDGRGATLQGPGKRGDLKSLESAGFGMIANGCSNVTIKNLKAKGFATGLVARDGEGWSVENCDFSDNYHNPEHGWGELPPRGGIDFKRIRNSVIKGCKANRVWNALELVESSNNIVSDNDFSHCSNVCVKLWKSSRNLFENNNLSYGLRIDRAKGEVHARDSTCVLIETGSNDNLWRRNDVTHGGDGIFIRVLNGWVSRGNVFIENDTSYANNNCIEAWSPGNTYIRNKANYGSHGIWIGGSDQTRLIGNEAAYNGQPDGFHNAPEPGFGHGGIVIVGPASHTLIDGNDCHHNNGGGIVFRGNGAEKTNPWRIEHWVVQNNRLHHNLWGIWGEWGDTIRLANNLITGNKHENHFKEVAHLSDLGQTSVKIAPIVECEAPIRALTGAPVNFDASKSRDPSGGKLAFQWDLGGFKSSEPSFAHTFEKPGFHRVGLTVSNGALAALAYRDLVVAEPVAEELGTEGQAGEWGFVLEGDNGSGKVQFNNDEDEALLGSNCLRWTPNPYPGLYATAIYPGKKNASWDLSAKSKLTFWIKVKNPNIPGFQNSGPVITLFGEEGSIEIKPTNDANLFVNLPFSEARWVWSRVEVPLVVDEHWTRKNKGEVDFKAVRGIGIGLDSWGGDPFFVWLDGLTFE